MGNPVTQFQIIARDPEAAAGFYSTLFGWTVTADNALGYRQIETGASEGIVGGIWPAPPQAPNFVQLFISVPDVAEAVRNAERLGAKSVVPATVLPAGEHMAILQDPQGMSFGLWHRPAART